MRGGVCGATRRGEEIASLPAVVRNDVVSRNEQLEGAGGVDGLVGEDAAPGDAVGAIGTHNNGSLEVARVSLHGDGVPARYDATDCHRLANLNSCEAGFGRQPGIELVPPNHA